MAFLEIRTLYLAYVIFGLLGVAVMALLWRQNRKRSPEMALWLVYYGLQPVALLLVTLRGVIPEFFSIVLANVLLVCGTIFLYAGLLRYVGEKSSQIHNGVMLAVFTLLHTILTYVYPSLSLRNANLGLAILYVSIQGAWLLLYRVRPELRPASAATGVIFALFCLAGAVQMIGNLILPHSNELFVPGLFGAAIILAYQTLFIMLTFALFLMVSRRLLMALESELIERSRTEKTLRESREQFQGLVETMYDWVWEVDAEGRYTYVSPQIKDILGYEPADLLGKMPFDLMPPGEAKRVSERFNALTREREPITALENTNIHRDGHPVVIETNGRPFYDADGQFRGYRGTDRDITGRKQAEEKLRKSEEKFSKAFKTSPYAIAITRLEDGRFIEVNDAFLAITGYSREELIRESSTALKLWVNPGDRDVLASIVRECAEIVGREFLFRKKNGDVLTGLVSAQTIELPEGTCILSSIDDITDRKHNEELLAAERQRMASILEGTNVGTWEWNVQTGATVFNERWAEMIGYTLAELAPVSIETWIKYSHPDDLAKSGDLLDRHFRKELPYYECEVRMQHRDGHWIWVLDRGRVATWTEDGKPLSMSGTHQDITMRKLAEEQIRYMATHDVLTGLPSLRLAMDRLSVSLSMARRQKTMAAVMFIDLDNFKGVNDTLGHDAGDHVLKAVAGRLLTCVRETDTVARIGGDELLLIATGLHSADDAARIAEKAIRSVSQPIDYNGQPLQVGASIGIALYPDQGDDIELLIKKADAAMYLVKNAGKNGFAFAEPVKEVSGQETKGFA